MGATTAALAISSAAAMMMQASQESDALNSQADYTGRMSRINERLNKLDAEDAIVRGESEARNVEKRGKQILGSQRANFAAQGIALDSGSAQDIQTETAESTAMDALTVRNNAALGAWGIKFQGQQASNKARMEMEGMRNTAGSTMLTGGMRAASSALSAYANRGGNSRKDKEA